MDFSKKTKFAIGLASAVICLLLLITGCAPHAEKIAKPEPEPQMPEAVTLALKFTPQDSTTYRLTTEKQQTLKFEGSLTANADFKGGHNSNKMEMTFTQQIQSIDDSGNAVAKITINLTAQDLNQHTQLFTSRRKWQPTPKTFGLRYRLCPFQATSCQLIGMPALDCGNRRTNRALPLTVSPWAVKPRGSLIS